MPDNQPDTATRTVVLLVDDDDDSRILMCEALRRQGLDVEEVGSGAACLDYVEHERVDLVVTDVEMPGMSGIELCCALTRLHPRLVSIVLTAVRGTAIVDAARASGAFSVMCKPVKTTALHAEIRLALACS